MPISPDEQARLDRLQQVADDSVVDQEAEPALGPTFLGKMIRGFVNLRDRVKGTEDAQAALQARVKALEDKVAQIPPPPPG